ncbi:GNAT family N-acetyltransferase [Paraburkholderia youngii]|uniref:GNAT family N-acetyltransferase n=1 Tax=Paraburkholderia youngii TaxID=2782701 RepID=UPI003D2170AF
MKRDYVSVTTLFDAIKPETARPSINESGGSIRRSGAHIGLAERSIFHEPWWLNAATDENWHQAVVRAGGEIIGEMPYTVSRKSLWRVSYLPPLTRTLGPVIQWRNEKARGPDWTYRLDVTRELIDQLPKCAHFHQVADPLVSEAEAAAFSLEGFKVSVQFTLKIPVGVDEETAWRQLRSKTRNRVRRSFEQFVVQEISSADTFVDFYESNLAARDLNNLYGSATMRRLLTEVLRRNAGTMLGAFDNDGSLSAATALVWDQSNVYYLLTSRKTTAHGGAVSLLVWHAMRLARERELELDFDGVSTPGILKFLAGFGGQLVRRYVFERMRADYAILRAVRASSRNLADLVRKIDRKENTPVE